jgi:chromosome condensin MukBEF MukE localization factor
MQPVLNTAVEHRLALLSEEELVGQLLCVYYLSPTPTG